MSMSEANRHAQSKDLLHLASTTPPNRISTTLRTLRQTWRPTYSQAAAEMQPSVARPVRL
jgi:hypothetical protein